MHETEKEISLPFYILHRNKKSSFGTLSLLYSVVIFKFRILHEYPFRDMIFILIEKKKIHKTSRAQINLVHNNMVNIINVMSVKYYFSGM